MSHELPSPQEPRVVRLQRVRSLRRRRKLVYLKEWLAAQAPWRRRLARRVSRRMAA